MKKVFLFFIMLIVMQLYLNIKNIFALTKDDLYIKEIDWVKPLQAYTWGTDVTIEKLVFTSSEQILMRLYIIIAIWVMIYIWFLFLTAEWKTEQFSKAWKAVVYALVWLTLVPLAYILVKIVTWINL